MSLNKFTDKGKKKEWMKIGCQEIKINELTIVGDLGQDGDVLTSDALGNLTLQPAPIPPPPPNVPIESFFMYGSTNIINNIPTAQYPNFTADVIVNSNFNSTLKPAYYTFNAGTGEITFLQSGDYMAILSVDMAMPAQNYFATFLLNDVRTSQQGVSSERTTGSQLEYLHLADTVQATAGQTLGIGIAYDNGAIPPPILSTVSFWKLSIYKMS